jgi:hypothetical protein
MLNLAESCKTDKMQPSLPAVSSDELIDCKSSKKLYQERPKAHAKTATHMPIC